MQSLSVSYTHLLYHLRQLLDSLRLVVLGIENNKPEAIKKLTEMVKDEPRIEVCPLLTKYPQGGCLLYTSRCV